MENKKNILAVVAAVLVAVVGFFSAFKLINEEGVKEAVDDVELVSNIYNVGYTDNVYNRYVVVSERVELEKFLGKFTNGKELLDKYDDSYFKDKSLALIYETTSNGAVSIKVNKLEVVGNGTTLEIDYSKEATADVGTAVMSGFLIVVEVPKSVKMISD